MIGRPLVRPAGPCFVLQHAGTLVGFAGAYVEPWMVPAGRRRLEIVVHPHFRGEGIGRRLLECLLQEARSAGLRVVDLRVRSDQPEGMGFAHRHGFRETEQICELELDVSGAAVTPAPGQSELVPPQAGSEISFSSYRLLLSGEPDAGRKIHRLWCALADGPGVDPATLPPEAALVAWLEQKTAAFDGCLVALDGSDYVGVCIV